MNEQARLQHYVPQFLLRGFARGKRRQLYVFDKSTDRSFRTAPRRVAAEQGFYDLPVSDGYVTLEPGLAGLESEAATIVHQLRTQGSLAGISEEQRIVLATFVAVQYLRTPHLRANIADMDRQLAEKLRAQGIDPSAVANYRPFESDNEVKAMAFSLLESVTEELVPQILVKDWILARAPASKPFIIGDNPVVLHNDRKFGFYGNIGFAVPGIQICLPLSERATLYMSCKSNSERVRQSAAQIKQLDDLGADSAELGRAATWVKRMMNSMDREHPLELEASNVEFFNSLQVLRAERWLFAADGNFDVARQMIARDPAIRNGPRGTVG